MKLEADLHMHTIASGHAYSTITEMALAAAGKGLKIIAMTDHGPLLPGGPHEYHFGNIKVLPEYIHGVRVLKGVESNIINDGSLDLDEERLDMLDFVAAGIHYDAGYNNRTMEEHTTATITAIKNPRVRMITHPANLYYPVDLQAVVKAAAENNVILEVNASSFDTHRYGKRGSLEKTVEMCKLAREYKVPLSLNSDAHYYVDVGNIEPLTQVIKEADLKEKDVINCSAEAVEEFLFQLNLA
ncbi:MAG: phosphatase [Halanaerobiales bacterium]